MQSLLQGSLQKSYFPWSKAQNLECSLRVEIWLLLTQRNLHIVAWQVFGLKVCLLTSSITTSLKTRYYLSVAIPRWNQCTPRRQNWIYILNGPRCKYCSIQVNPKIKLLILHLSLSSKSTSEMCWAFNKMFSDIMKTSMLPLGIGYFFSLSFQNIWKHQIPNSKSKFKINIT